MNVLPVPPVPADCDCLGLPFMPLHVGRLRSSDILAMSTGEEFKAAVCLWMAAWERLPASSLPNDDRILAALSGCSKGRWGKIRTVALRGFQLCSDGRLYHPLIAEYAVTAFAKRRGASPRRPNLKCENALSGLPETATISTIRPSNGEYRISKEESLADLSTYRDLSGQRSQVSNIQSLDAARKLRAVTGGSEFE